MFAERRDSYRFNFQKGQVSIKYPPTLTTAKIGNMSAGGSNIIVPVGQMDGLGKTPIEFKLGNNRPFRTGIVLTRMVEEDGFISIGTCFKNLKADELSVLSEFLVDQFLEESQKYESIDFDRTFSIIKKKQKTIWNLLRYYCIFRRTPLTIYDGDVRLPLILHVSELIEETGRQLIQVKAQNKDDEFIKKGNEYLFSFPGVNSINYFKADVLRSEPGCFFLIFPSMIYQRGFRNSIRVTPDSGLNIKFIVSHPRLQGFSLNKPVLEMGARGFSFPLILESDLLFPGESLMDGTLTLPDGPVRIGGFIRSIRKYGGKLAYGFEILRFADKEEERRWKSLVLQSTYHQLKIGKKEDVATYWEVLETSEYIGKIVTSTLRPMIKKRFYDLWEKHTENHLVGQHLLFYQRKKAIATLAMNLFYPDTSLGHHFSIDKRIRKEIFDVSRELTAGFLYMLKHMVDTKYFLSYFYADKAWNDWMYGRFLSNYPMRENFIYDRNYLYKSFLDYKQSNLMMPKKGIEVTCENNELLMMFSQFLEQKLPAIEFVAFSYNQDEISLKAFSKQCLSHEYERSRRIFFAVENGRPLAALVAETGDIGVNTFSLLNSCWIIYIEDEAKEDERVLEALLIQATQFYIEKKKMEFLFIDYDGLPKKRFEKHGIKYFGDGMRWLASREILPAYINYIEETFGMLHHKFRPE